MFFRGGTLIPSYKAVPPIIKARATVIRFIIIKCGEVKGLNPLENNRKIPQMMSRTTVRLNKMTMEINKKYKI